MPRLICLLPCENLIISNENKVSLISLLENISIALPQGQAVPSNAVIPMRWWAVTIWERESADSDQEFETYVEVGGSPIHTPIARFKFSSPMHRALHVIQGFPLAPGQNVIRAYIKEASQPNFAVAGSYPVSIQFLRPGQVN